MATPLRRLIAEKVGDLDAFVAQRRDRGESWQSIALDIYAATGVRVTDETIRGWYGRDAA